MPVLVQPAFLQSVLEVHLLDRMLDIPVVLQLQVQTTVDSAVAVLLGVAQCLVRQWFHILRKLEDRFWKNSRFPRDWVDSAPEVDSRPALLRSGRALRRQRQWHVLY